MIFRQAISPTRRGALLVLFAVLLVVLLGFVGLAVDTGFITLAKAQLQNAADAAATAGTARLLDRDELMGSPNQVAERVHARDDAQAIAAANAVVGAAIALDRNDGNNASGDLVTGYLANPTGNRDALTHHSGAVPSAFSPPLLFLPSIVNPNIPFITPPAVTGAYRSENSVQATAHRDAQRNGRLDLVFGGINGIRSVDLTATATATYEDNIRGFRIDRATPPTSKLLPYAMDVNAFAAVAAGLSTLDLYRYDPARAVPPNSYASRVSFATPTLGALLGNTGSALSILLDPRRYAFDLSSLYVAAPVDPALAALLPGDRIKEALLVPLVVPKQTVPLPLGGPDLSVSVGNFGTIYIGIAPGDIAGFMRQVQYGPNAADFAAMGGAFQLGSNGTLVVQGDVSVTTTLKELLLSIRGQPRVMPLYRPTSVGPFPQLLNQAASYTIVGFGGVVILEVLDIPPIIGTPAIPPVINPLTGNVLVPGIPGIPAVPASLKLLVQPEFVIDATAVGGGSTLANGGAVTSRFVYRPVAITR